MTPYTGPALSKSRFLAGLQCPLRLWHQCYNRKLASPVTPAQEAIFEMGHRVGILATQKFAGGRLIAEDHFHHDRAVQTTREAMADPGAAALFEAGFFEDGVRVRADILQRLRGGFWNLIEVKSATGVKDEHHTDVAIQYKVLRQAGVRVDRAFLMHIDSSYLHDGGPIDLDLLFTLADLTEVARGLEEFVSRDLDALKGMLSASDPPAIAPSRHCHRPHTCEFWAHCTKDKPPDWVFYLFGINQEKMDALAASGIDRIGDIPGDFPLTAVQERVRDCVKRGTAYVSPDLKALLGDVVPPVHFLDFETAAPAVPRYAGTRPFQALPFQWSDHVLSADGGLVHRQFLHTEDSDPRSAFAETLFEALGDKGSIVIYTPYEKRILRETAEVLPQFTERVKRLADRFVDLHAIVRNHYYHPAFLGSFSIKAVLPALVPEMDYKHLAVQDGTQASFAWLKMVDPATPDEEKAAIQAALLEYCGQDTLAMVKVREELLRRC
ncbi:MAG: DUF2779 domain-containing protein [Desulfobacterales bacterium]|jgi:hypothetical protein